MHLSVFALIGKEISLLNVVLFHVITAQGGQLVYGSDALESFGAVISRGKDNHTLKTK